MVQAHTNRFQIPSASAGRGPWLLLPWVLLTEGWGEGPSWDQITTSGGCRGRRLSCQKHTLKLTAFGSSKEKAALRDSTPVSCTSHRTQAGCGRSWVLIVCISMLYLSLTQWEQTEGQAWPPCLMVLGLLPSLAHHRCSTAHKMLVGEDLSTSDLLPSCCLGDGKANAFLKHALFYRARMLLYGVFSRPQATIMTLPT